MQRRNFLQTTGMAALSAGLSRLHPFSAMPEAEKPRIIRPARLREGATIALIAPSSPPAPEKLAKAIANLSGFGYTIVEGKSLRAQYGHLAGSDAARLADLHEAFRDPAIDAVWCVRGGYGAGRLLPHIDYELIRRHPKPLIGYSDITALHIAIHQRTGLVTFHGPVAASDFPADTLHYFESVLTRPVAPCIIQPAGPLPEGPEYPPFVIRPGKAEGRLTGGNLALLSAMVGTPYAPKFDKKIVFIEDVGEQPYRIDRMLTQLLQGSDLKKAAGIALGVFAECQPKPGTFSLSLPDTLRDCLGALGIPVVYGIPFGHVANQATLPYGIRATLDAEKFSLTLEELAAGSR
ncbi:MAG: LD-carboxypeptidase [Saprospiraceae bacterium]|nr:LD-carboxypeptidase [Saprospiraceae bacterium]